VITSSRWATYATASAASTLMPIASVEADIHYSGAINRRFDAPPGGKSVGSFPLDRGVSLYFDQALHASGRDGSAYMNIRGADEAFAGNYVTYAGVYVAKLPAHRSLPRLRSQGRFDAHCTTTSILHHRFCAGGIIGLPYSANGYFRDGGTGFIGFDFDSGHGTQYGWARIKTTGKPKFRFILIDYAWGDVGDNLRTGQTSSADPANTVSTSGSLGLLAVGALGLNVWRRRRRRHARMKTISRLGD